MQLKLSFSETEIKKLFLAYQNKPDNYKEIKNLVIGDGADEAFRRSSRGRLVFMVAVTIITIAGSMYPIFLKDYQSALAVWAVWAVLLIVSLVWSSVVWNTSHKVLLENQVFFEKFEEIAQDAMNLDHFNQLWTEQDSYFTDTKSTQIVEK
ncbi:MAG: hypothetical protein MK212_01795 [Saprospiraceae bacterium]|nr:hypothetical protein [Saprospiraceae bacterium]